MIKFNHLCNTLKANDSFACIYIFFYLKYVNVIKIALIGEGVVEWLALKAENL